MPLSRLGGIRPLQRATFGLRQIGHAPVVTTRATAERPRVAVFDPTPVLTIVVESLDGKPDVHLHAGGQGVWVARMLVELDMDAILCAPIGGETGVVLAGLARDEGIALRSVDSPGSCGAYINDRRSGKREEWVAMPPTPLGRHVLDEVYGLFIGESAGASVAVLTGPREAGAVPADTYRRLAGDCRELGTAVVADLAGDTLTSALAGGVTVLKVSEDELRAHGRLADAATADDSVAVARRLRDDGADHVVVSRGSEAAIVLIDDEVRWAHGPQLSPADHRGAGDSMTAGIAAGLARGLPLDEAVRIGVAAGAVTVSRHGLATGDRRSIDSLVSAVTLRQGVDHEGRGRDAGPRDQ